MNCIKKRFAKAKMVSSVVQFGENESVLTDAGTESTTLVTDCTVADKGSRLEIEYEESEITGMEGSVTKLFFDKDKPSLVSILREGSISTALVFEKGRRHVCVYETPYFPIELCVDTQTLSNTLSYTGGCFEAEYLVEMNGVLTERTHIIFSIIN